MAGITQDLFGKNDVYCVVAVGALTQRTATVNEGGAAPRFGDEGETVAFELTPVEMRPVQSKIRVPLFAARTLNAAGQSRVTLSPR